MVLKRFKSAMAFAAMGTLMLAGCGTVPQEYTDEFVGVYELKEYTDAEGNSDESIDAMMELGMTAYLTLGEDGTASLSIFGESQDGTWKAVGEDSANCTIVDRETGVEAVSDMVLAENHQLTLSNDGEIMKFDFLGKDAEVGGMTAEEFGKALMDDSESSEMLRGSMESFDEGTAEELDETLADDDNVTIKLKGIGEYSGDPAYLLELTNKTDSLLMFMNFADDWTVDGNAHNPVLYDTVEPGKTRGSIMWFEDDDLEGIESLKNVKGTISVSHSLDNSYESIGDYPIDIE